jgi:hypothetical protein
MIQLASIFVVLLMIAGCASNPPKPVANVQPVLVANREIVSASVMSSLVPSTAPLVGAVRPPRCTNCPPPIVPVDMYVKFYRPKAALFTNPKSLQWTTNFTTWQTAATNLWFELGGYATTTAYVDLVCIKFDSQMKFFRAVY